MMIEGFLIVTLWKCNNPRVVKNQQTPTLIADFQISVRTVAFTHFNSLCQFKLIFQNERVQLCLLFFLATSSSKPFVGESLANKLW